MLEQNCIVSMIFWISLSQADWIQLYIFEIMYKKLQIIKKKKKKKWSIKNASDKNQSYMIIFFASLMTKKSDNENFEEIQKIIQKYEYQENHTILFNTLSYQWAQQEPPPPGQAHSENWANSFTLSFLENSQENSAHSPLSLQTKHNRSRRQHHRATPRRARIWIFCSSIRHRTRHRF